MFCHTFSHCVQAGGGPGEELVVTQFHMTGWPEHGRPASTGSVLELLDMTTRAQMNSGNRPITVICKSDSIANTTVVYIFLCVCHLYNNLSVDLFYLSLSPSPKLSISHLLYCPSVVSFLSPSPFSPVMEWVEQEHSSVSTLSWSDSRQRVWPMCSRPSSQLVSRELASSEMQYVVSSVFLSPSLSCLFE